MHKYAASIPFRGLSVYTIGNFSFIANIKIGRFARFFQRVVLSPIASTPSQNTLSDDASTHHGSAASQARSESSSRMGPPASPGISPRSAPPPAGHPTITGKPERFVSLCSPGTRAPPRGPSARFRPNCRPGHRPRGRLARPEEHHMGALLSPPRACSRAGRAAPGGTSAAPPRPRRSGAMPRPTDHLSPPACREASAPLPCCPRLPSSPSAIADLVGLDTAICAGLIQRPSAAAGR